MTGRGTYGRNRRALPRPAGDMVSRVLGRVGARGKLGDYEVWSVWDEVVGPAVARVTQPASLRKGKLSVTVASAAWHHALHQEKAALLEKLNNRLGRRTITDIRFRGDAPPLEPRVLRPEERATAEAFADEVPDEELRELIRRTAESFLRRE